MKNIFFMVAFIIMTAFVVCSCSTTHQNNTFFPTYKSVDNCASGPMFITLKNHNMTFEIYSPTMCITTIGMWKTKGDTLICTPYLDYAVEKGKLYTENLSRHHKTVTSIPKRYLIKGNILLDITDYRQIYPEFMGTERPIYSQYKLIK